MGDGWLSIFPPLTAPRACAKSRNIGRALSLYEVVKHKKLPLDSYFYAATIEGKPLANLHRTSASLSLGYDSNSVLQKQDVAKSIGFTS